MNKLYTPKQRLYIWCLYMLRHFIDIISGLIGIISLNLFNLWLGVNISEKILLYKIKAYKDNKDKSL
jgi:hypothetical protein